MALIEINKIDQIEVLENNCLQVRTASIIEKDGVEISRSNHRHTLVPTDDISKEDAKVQAIANSIWTKEVIQFYKDSLIQNNNLQNAI
jgi:hypothetical protein